MLPPTLIGSARPVLVFVMKSGSVPYTNETVVVPLLALTVALRRALQPVTDDGLFATIVGGVTGGASDLNVAVGVVNEPLSFVAVTRTK